jgi:transposase
MPQERLSVRKIRELLRLRLEEKRSLREVGRSVGVSPSVVHDCVVRFRATGLEWPLRQEIDEVELEKRMYGTASPGRSGPFIQPDFAYVHTELRRKGVTMYLLWQEYRQAHPEDGYQYSRFCELYNRWAKPLSAVLRQQHKAGDKAFVDWSGDGIDVVDPMTGEVTELPLFVAALGASTYAFAKAAPSRQAPHWIALHNETVEYFQGVPAATVPDNEKTGVKSPCLYDPDLNPTYAAWARHYGTAVIPTRPRKPKDKAVVENAVLNAQRWILAALRNHTFFSLAEANQAISEKVEEYNGRKLQKLDVTRRQLFESLDLPELKPLPSRRFEYFDWKWQTLQIDYHVVVEQNYYSVPYRLIGKRVEARWTASTVEVFFQGNRVACHPRNYGKWNWISDDAHRPPKHRAYLEWTPERIVAWASRTGPETARLVEQILSSRQHPEQGYRACLGVMRLGKRYSEPRLEAACSRALALKSTSYTTVRSILEHGADRLPLPKAPEPKQPSLPFHDNIRGPNYYQ